MSSRGRLETGSALQEFDLNVEGLVAFDVGASTGGFTDCLLQKGARKVYALDVAYGQLAWKLREDKRVVVIERTNCRYYDGADLDEKIDLAVIDASFISLKIVIPAVLKFLEKRARILALIKPQFEARREEVAEGGVVQETSVQERVVKDIRDFCESQELEVEGTCASPILALQEYEFFILARKKIK
jgi:23S rRNA (cytidine1920-2'-O)/16S rRNA (cytidine1409-2'-O)-methyltransferase